MWTLLELTSQAFWLIEDGRIVRGIDQSGWGIEIRLQFNSQDSYFFIELFDLNGDFLEGHSR